MSSREHTAAQDALEHLPLQPVLDELRERAKVRAKAHGRPWERLAQGVEWMLQDVVAPYLSKFSLSRESDLDRVQLFLPLQRQLDKHQRRVVYLEDQLAQAGRVERQLRSELATAQRGQPSAEVEELRAQVKQLTGRLQVTQFELRALKGKQSTSI